MVYPEASARGSRSSDGVETGNSLRALESGFLGSSEWRQGRMGFWDELLVQDVRGDLLLDRASREVRTSLMV